MIECINKNIISLLLTTIFEYLVLTFGHSVSLATGNSLNHN